MDYYTRIEKGELTGVSDASAPNLASFVFLDPAATRFYDDLAGAAAICAKVLRAQAADVREHGRRALMEVSGKKEVGMLVPVVLFVLPVTVVFALYPTLAVLQLGP